MQDADASTSGVAVRLAPWPALIGIASMLVDHRPVGAAGPETQYELCAERVLDALSPDVKSGLATLAALPLVDRDIASAVLGCRAAQTVCNRAVELGLLDERDGRLEVHRRLQVHLGRVRTPESERTPLVGIAGGACDVSTPPRMGRGF